MNYQAFKDHIVSFLWREGDQVLIDNLDNLIRMADATLRVDIRPVKRLIFLPADFVNGSYTLANENDHRIVRSVNTEIGQHRYITPAQMAAERRTDNKNLRPLYSIIGGDAGLMVQITAVEDTISGSVAIYTDIPNFQDTDKSWLADEHLDLYTYAVLQHASLFLREDERLPNWVNMYQTHKENYKEDQAIFGNDQGIAASLPLPYPASPMKGRHR